MVAQKISNVLHFQKRCKYINTNGTLVDVWGMAKSHSRRVSLFHNCKCFVCIYEMTRLATLARWLQQIVIVLQNLFICSILYSQLLVYAAAMLLSSWWLSFLICMCFGTFVFLYLQRFETAAVSPNGSVLFCSMMFAPRHCRVPFIKNIDLKINKWLLFSIRNVSVPIEHSLILSRNPHLHPEQMFLLLEMIQTWTCTLLWLTKKETQTRRYNHSLI